MRIHRLALWASLALLVPSLGCRGETRQREEDGRIPPATRTLPSEPANIPPQQAALAKSVRGTVTDVDISAGLITLRTVAADVRTLRGTPAELEGAEVGRNFVGTYTTYGNQAWLAEERHPAHALTHLGEKRTVRGFVARVDAEQGQVMLATPEGEDIPLSIHPVRAEPLILGQQVNVMVFDVDGRDWVGSVRPAPAHDAVRGQAPEGTHDRFLGEGEGD